MSGRNETVETQSALFPTTGAHRLHCSHNDSFESESLTSGKTDCLISILTGVSREVIGKYAPLCPRLYPPQSHVPTSICLHIRWFVCFDTSLCTLRVCLYFDWLKKYLRRTLSKEGDCLTVDGWLYRRSRPSASGLWSDPEAVHYRIHTWIADSHLV